MQNMKSDAANYLLNTFNRGNGGNEGNAGNAGNKDNAYNLGNGVLAQHLA